MRRTVRLADTIAPALVARFALWAWCRPGRSRRRYELTPGGTAWSMPFGRSVVVGHTWGTGPRVYLVHGWGGRQSHLGALVEPLVEAGFQVVAYDAPSHGDSGPGAFGAQQSTLPELAEALAAVVAHHGEAHAVIGHSLGGATTALGVLEGLMAKRIVLVAPMTDPLPYTYDFAEALGISESTRRRFVALVERRVGRRFVDFDLPRRAVEHRGPLPPLLVLHDRDDNRAMYTDGVRLADGWPDGRLVTSSNLGHHRILRDPQMVARIVAEVGRLGD